jgi:hypothetical protein
MSAVTSTSDRITTLKTEINAIKAKIKDLNTQCNALELELNKLEQVPIYINRAVQCIVDVCGENAKWQKKIRAILTKHLQTEPIYDYTYDMGKYEQMIIQSVDYIWDDTRYVYNHIDPGMGDKCFTYFGDSYFRNDNSLGDPVDVRDSCVEFSEWDDFNEFDMKNLPILIAYLEDKLPLDKN